MKTLRPSLERGKENIGWLNTKYSFSFANYYDEQWMGYKTLRVINEDIIAPDNGFGMHPHRDMEIITYIIKGQIQHTDNMGNKEIIEAGEIQQMSAGTGIYHAEFNPSQSEELHLLQIWIQPNKRGVKPQYGKKKILDLKNELNLIISNQDSDNVLKIHQNAKIYSGVYTTNKNIEIPVKDNSAFWFQIIKGTVNVNQTTLNTGDGLGIENEKVLNVQISANSEFLLFELQ